MEHVLTRFGVRTLIILAGLFFLSETAFATTAVRPSDDDLIIGARAIVRGKVVSIESAYDDASHRIYTYVTVKVQEVFKGQINERRIVLRELGGQVGDRAMGVYGNPQFRRGERVFLYLDTWADGSLRTYQMFLGKFSIAPDPQTGLKFVIREMSDQHVVVLPQPDGGAQGPSTDRMELQAYIDMVRERRATTDEASEVFASTYYSDTSLRTEPPEFASVSSGGDFSAQFALLGNVRWFEPDSGQPVTYTVNTTPSSVPGFPPLSVPESDVAAAANAWSVVPGCALRITLGGLQSDCYLDSGTLGINVVSNNCDGRNAPTTSCSGILAWGGYSAGTFESKIVNGVSFRRITQGFISFNPYAVCYFGDHCDVQEITTHEMGHALGLNHSADPTATMYSIAHFDGRCASIKQDDANGIIFIYPATGSGPGPLSITTSSLAAGTVGSAYSQTLIGSGGTTPYTWSLVAGQGSLPAGLNLSAAGVIGGTPTASGTSNFTVSVTDAATGSAQKALSIVVTSGGAPLDSQFVSQNVPLSLIPGQSFNANLKFLNTGTQTWSGSGFWLVSQNPPQNTTWGGNGVSLSSYSIAPGQQLDITFTAFAPATPGTYDFQWQVYQNGGVGFFGQPSANLSIQVGNPVLITSGSPLPGGTVGSLYSQFLSAQGGTSPYTWSVVAGFGSLPGGLSLSTAGVISGTPNSAGTFNFTVRANDSTSGSAQRAFSITVVAAKTPPSIQGQSSLVAIRNSAFSYQLGVSGGKPQFSWTVASGGLPPGIALSASSGLIAGAPTTVGAWTFTIQVTDADGAKDQKPMTINVVPSALVIGDTAVPDCEVGSKLSFQLSASGGIAPYRWGLTAGSLPPGVTLDAETGLLSGTPATPGIFDATILVTDALATSALKPISITVKAAPLKLMTTLLESAGRMSPYGVTLEASGGVGPYRWSIVEGGLPDGLSLDATTGLISGIPETNGHFQFMVVLTDQLATSIDRTLEIAVADTLPHINSATYKASGEHLVVKGNSFDKKGMLLVDGVPVTARLKTGKANAYDLRLSPGSHEIRVVTRDGVVSNAFVVDASSAADG